MGTPLKEKTAESLAANNAKRSKGERLGWKSLSEYTPVPIKDIVSDGRAVTEVGKFSSTPKLVS
ncbi:MAG: hypothetical protein LBL97_06935 [Prevotellaceae bacterium]|jgi:hypothetical protein|nr:hypothetical protein [Prevotellaceae bacterium]